MSNLSVQTVPTAPADAGPDASSVLLDDVMRGVRATLSLHCRSDLVGAVRAALYTVLVEQRDVNAALVERLCALFDGKVMS